MKIALTASTWDFIRLGGEYAGVERVVRDIYALGLAPELWLNWTPRAATYDRSNWERLREFIRPSPNLSFHTRNDRGCMFEEIELLAFLGGRVLVVHPCVLSLAGHKEEQPDLPFVRELAAAARAHGVFLGLENIFGRAFLDRTLAGADTFDDRGGLGICIDIGHAELRRNDPRESALDLIRDYGPHLLHLHVHDIQDGKDHLPLGEGTIDYAAIAAALREADFQGTAVLEIQAEDPLAMLKSGIEFLRKRFGAELTLGANQPSG